MNGRLAKKVQKVVEIELLDPVLKEHYGSTMRISEDKAIHGERRGKWRIVNGQLTELKYATRAISVSIIILCWNNLEYTKKCIESIRKNTELNYQLVIVDNGSTDGTLQYAETILNERDMLIRSSKNMGFSSGNNLGARVTTGEYLLFLNNDCEVGVNWLEQLITASEDAVLVGASLAFLEKDDKKKILYYRGVCKNDAEPMSYLEGWCLLIRRKDFLHLEGFDIQFDPFFSEDADLSFKCREAGLKIKKLPDVPYPVHDLIHHHRGKSIVNYPNASIVRGENDLKLYKKWVEVRKLFGSKQSGAEEKTMDVMPSAMIKPYERVVLTEL